MTITFGKFLTLYFSKFIPRSKFDNSNLPTIILQIKFFKLMFKTDGKQSLVEVSTRVKVPNPVSSSAYLLCSSNKFV